MGARARAQRRRRPLRLRGHAPLPDRDHLRPHGQGRPHRGAQGAAGPRHPRQLALDALRALLSGEEDRPQDLQRRRQRHRRHGGRLGDDPVHPRGVAGRASRLPVAGRRRELRAVRSPGAHRQRAAPREVRRRGHRRQGPRRAGQGDLAEPQHPLLARHGQGLGPPPALQGQGQEQAEQVPEADPRRRRAQAAPLEQEGVEPPLPQLRGALQRPLQERLQGAQRGVQEVLRADARVHERARRDAAAGAHADQPQAAQGPGPARLGDAPRAGRLLHRVARGHLRLQVPRPHRPVRVRLRPQAVLRRHAHDDDQHREGDRLHPQGDRRGAAGRSRRRAESRPAACSSTATRSC